MVDLMLQRLREEAFGVPNAQLLTGPVQGFHRNALGAIQAAPEARHRQAAFVHLDLADRLHDLGVHNYGDHVIDVDDGKPQRHADLRCSQANPRRRLHRFDHVVDQLLHRPIDLADPLGLLAQDGHAYHHDRTHGHRGFLRGLTWLEL